MRQKLIQYVQAETSISLEVVQSRRKSVRRTSGLTLRYVSTRTILEGSRWDGMRSEAATVIAPKNLRTRAIERLYLARRSSTSGAHFSLSTVGLCLSIDALVQLCIHAVLYNKIQQS